jgi:hypothetical protein
MAAWLAAAAAAVAAAQRRDAAIVVLAASDVWWSCELLVGTISSFSQQHVCRLANTHTLPCAAWSFAISHSCTCVALPMRSCQQLQRTLGLMLSRRTRSLVDILWLLSF